jgi:hypothetical protein
MISPSSDCVFSTVVALVSDTTDSHCDLSHLAGCLDALGMQREAPPSEVIVPYPAGLPGMDAMRTRFPGVRFIPCDDLKTYTGRGGSREHHDELRARGLAAARGEIVGLIEDHARPGPEWVRAMAGAHRESYAGVGGAMDNSVDRALNWAVYYCDFGRYQNPLPPGPVFNVSDANVSYKRAALQSVHSVWIDSYHEARVNGALFANGGSLGTQPEAVVYQHRQGLRVGSALKERFVWGYSFAAGRARSIPLRNRLIYTLVSPILPGLLSYRMARDVIRRKSSLLCFVRALPYIVPLTVSWSCGEMCGYLARQQAVAATALDKQLACSPAGSE